MRDGLELLKPFLPGLEDVLEDPEVSEIMINGPHNVWIEGHGKLYSHEAPLLTAAALQRAAIHIARPLGLDPSTAPIVDARLEDGSRVAICVPPASPKVAITVRRFGKRSFSAADLLQALNTGHGGSLTTVHANNAESALSRLASCAMQGGGELPWEVTCRGVVDGIAMVIHMTRREGRRFVEEALLVEGYDATQNRWLIEPIGRQHDKG